MKNRKAIGVSLLRNAVHSTHRWPVLGAAYRAIYRSAADAVKRLVNQNRQIIGLYVRNSYALGTWEAGRSDIDFTVIWTDPREAEILRFRQSYAKLQKRFPMLGEVEMIDTNHFGSWAQHGFDGLHSRQWKRIAGAHKAQSSYCGSEELDRLRHAVSVYRNQFLRYFWADAPAHILERVAAKIARLLGKSSVPKGGPAQLLRGCLDQLTYAVRTIALPVAGLPIDVNSLLGKLEPPKIVSSSPEVEGVQCVIAPNFLLAEKHVLLEGNFDLEKIKSAYPLAILWNRDLFRFNGAFVDPIEYFAMLRDRIIVFGKDPCLEELPMTDELLRDAVCQYATYMLTYPYRTDLAGLSDRDFENILWGWYLRVLRYFEHGTLIYDYTSLGNYFGVRFADHRSRFSLLHSLASELADHLSADAPATISRDFQRTA